MILKVLAVQYDSFACVYWTVTSSNFKEKLEKHYKWNKIGHSSHCVFTQ